MRRSGKEGSGSELASVARVFETHISTIFLVGDRAYKLKKPLKTGFLDFSTTEARREACLEEVGVNRRFAPDIYLGVADVIGPDGAVCDHLVVMKRMPEDRRLSTLVRDGTVKKKEIEDLARFIAEIHRSAPRSKSISRDGGQDALHNKWHKNFAEIRPYVGRYVEAEQLDLAELLAARYLVGRGPLFEQRITEGRIVDGHGDLLADDIYLLADGPRILDALEFDEHLRHVDVIDDVASLAMDLERLGAPELSRALLEAYIEVSGNRPPPSLADHYIAYRAMVRAKVAAMRADQGDREAAPQAYLLMRLAVEYLVAGRVALVLIGGLPGSGKSTLAKALGEACRWTVLSSDIVRKDLAGICPTAPAPSRYRRGIYSKHFTQETYNELLDQAGTLLRQGISVILDASWIDSSNRQAAAELSLATSSDLVEFHFAVSRQETLSRLEHRSEVGLQISDATADIAASMARDEHPWSSAIEIDTEDSMDTVLKKMLAAISIPRPSHGRVKSPSARSA